MWLHPLFLGKAAGVALNVRTCLSSSSNARYKGKFTSYWEVLNYLLPTYTTGYIIEQVDMDIINFKQPTVQRAFEYLYALWTEALCCRPVYDAFSITGTFIEKLEQPILHSSQSYCA